MWIGVENGAAQSVNSRWMGWIEDVSMADEYIKRRALLDAYDAAHKGPPGGARKLIAEAPAEDVAPVVHGAVDSQEWSWRVRPMRSGDGGMSES